MFMLSYLAQVLLVLLTLVGPRCSFGAVKGSADKHGDPDVARRAGTRDTPRINFASLSHREKVREVGRIFHPPRIDFEKVEACIGHTVTIKIAPPRGVAVELHNVIAQSPFHASFVYAGDTITVTYLPKHSRPEIIHNFITIETSHGDFEYPVTGSAIPSRFHVEPVTDLTIPPALQYSRTLRLYNPYPDHIVSVMNCTTDSLWPFIGLKYSPGQHHWEIGPKQVRDLVQMTVVPIFPGTIEGYVDLYLSVVPLNQRRKRQAARDSIVALKIPVEYTLVSPGVMPSQKTIDFGTVTDFTTVKRLPLVLSNTLSTAVHVDSVSISSVDHIIHRPVPLVQPDLTLPPGKPVEIGSLSYKATRSRNLKAGSKYGQFTGTLVITFKVDRGSEVEAPPPVSIPYKVLFLEGSIEYLSDNVQFLAGNGTRKSPMKALALKSHFEAPLTVTSAQLSTPYFEIDKAVTFPFVMEPHQLSQHIRVRPSSKHALFAGCNLTLVTDLVPSISIPLQVYHGRLAVTMTDPRDAQHEAALALSATQDSFINLGLILEPDDRDIDVYIGNPNPVAVDVTDIQSISSQLSLLNASGLVGRTLRPGESAHFLARLSVDAEGEGECTLLVASTVETKAVKVVWRTLRGHASFVRHGSQSRVTVDNPLKISDVLMASRTEAPVFINCTSNRVLYLENVTSSDPRVHMWLSSSTIIVPNAVTEIGRVVVMPDTADGSVASKVSKGSLFKRKTLCQDDIEQRKAIELANAEAGQDLNAVLYVKLTDESMTYSLTMPLHINTHPQKAVVIPDATVDFGMVPVGRSVEKPVVVSNPSNAPLHVQLLRWSEVPTPLVFSLASALQVQIPDERHTAQHADFTFPPHAVRRTVVPPGENATLGPIVFKAGSSHRSGTVFVLRNSISGVEALAVSGSGGKGVLTLIGSTAHYDEELLHDVRAGGGTAAVPSPGPAQKQRAADAAAKKGTGTPAPAAATSASAADSPVTRIRGSGTAAAAVVAGGGAATGSASSAAASAVASAAVASPGKDTAPNSSSGGSAADTSSAPPRSLETPGERESPAPQVIEVVASKAAFDRFDPRRQFGTHASRGAFVPWSNLALLILHGVSWLNTSYIVPEHFHAGAAPRGISAYYSDPITFSRTFSFSNNGNCDVHLTAARLKESPDAADGACSMGGISIDDCETFDRHIPPGGAATISITYTPDFTSDRTQAYLCLDSHEVVNNFAFPVVGRIPRDQLAMNYDAIPHTLRETLMRAATLGLLLAVGMYLTLGVSTELGVTHVVVDRVAAVVEKVVPPAPAPAPAPQQQQQQPAMQPPGENGGKVPTLPAATATPPQEHAPSPARTPSEDPTAVGAAAPTAQLTSPAAKPAPPPSPATPPAPPATSTTTSPAPAGAATTTTAVSARTNKRVAPTTPPSAPQHTTGKGGSGKRANVLETNVYVSTECPSDVVTSVTNTPSSSQEPSPVNSNSVSASSKGEANAVTTPTSSQQSGVDDSLRGAARRAAEEGKKKGSKKDRKDKDVKAKPSTADKKRETPAHVEKAKETPAAAKRAADGKDARRKDAAEDEEGWVDVAAESDAGKKRASPTLPPAPPTEPPPPRPNADAAEQDRRWRKQAEAKAEAELKRKQAAVAQREQERERLEKLKAAAQRHARQEETQRRPIAQGEEHARRRLQRDFDSITAALRAVARTLQAEDKDRRSVRDKERHDRMRIQQQQRQRLRDVEAQAAKRVRAERQQQRRGAPPAQAQPPAAQEAPAAVHAAVPPRQRSPEKVWTSLFAGSFGNGAQGPESPEGHEASDVVDSLLNAINQGDGAPGPVDRAPGAAVGQSWMFPSSTGGMFQGQYTQAGGKGPSSGVFRQQAAAPGWPGAKATGSGVPSGGGLGGGSVSSWDWDAKPQSTINTPAAHGDVFGEAPPPPPLFSLFSGAGGPGGADLMGSEGQRAQADLLTELRTAATKNTNTTSQCGLNTKADPWTGGGMFGPAVPSQRGAPAGGSMWTGGAGGGGQDKWGGGVGDKGRTAGGGSGGRLLDFSISSNSGLSSAPAGSFGRPRTGSGDAAAAGAAGGDEPADTGASSLFTADFLNQTRATQAERDRQMQRDPMGGREAELNFYELFKNSSASQDEDPMQGLKVDDLWPSLQFDNGNQ